MKSIIYEEMIMPKLLESEDTFTDCNKEKADELRVKITEFLGDDAKLLSLYTTCLQTYYETIRDKECSYCLNKGIEIGLELKNNFNNMEEDNTIFD